ncbi:MAG TPA: M36 family metallopeptidase, partial [Vicinamibacteria bacterium]
MGGLLQPAPPRVALRRAACLLVALLPASALAFQKPRPEDRVLPNFDSRLRGPRAAGRPELMEAAIERLRRGGPRSLRGRLHPATGALRVLSAQDGGALTEPSAEEPETVARRFLRENPDLFGLSEDDVAGLVKAREYVTGGGALRHLRFDQVVDGIAVFGGTVGVHLDAAGRVVRVTSGALASARLDDPEEVTLDAAQAVRAAAADIRPELPVEPQALTSPGGRARAARFARGPFRRDLPAHLVQFPAWPRARLAWHVRVEPHGFPQSYDVLVDARTGEILFRRNRVLYADGAGNVSQSDATAALDARRPDERPAGFDPPGPGDLATGCPPVSGHRPRSLTLPFRDPATVLGNTGRLEGNNTRAALGTPGNRPAAGALLDGTWHFDFPFGSAGAAQTHLFFASNFAHDFFYDLGFDEAAGNFQASNFGRGGLGGDPLEAVARANGRNNATFQPEPEGRSPVMSMFLFDGAGCWSADVDGDGLEDLDGDYDADVVIHEYHHGVSTRLNPAWTGAEADAMGEGGGDFFAYSIYGNTKLAESVMPPEGIRQVNEKTYGDWFCFFFFLCLPHDNGEIFANVLWDLRERFRLDLAGGSEAVAVHEVHRLYVDALKLSPPSPTMLDLRDAILQADRLRHPSADTGGSENHCRIWTAFAGRGMGQHALDTHDTGDLSVVADFTVPAPCPQPPPKPTITVTVADAVAAEAGSDTAAFTFARTGDVERPLGVTYTAEGTATPGADYVVLSGTVTFPAGAAEATVILAALDDALVEPDETVTLTLQPGAGYLVGSPGSATARIVSEDVAPDLAITTASTPRTAGAGQPLTVTETTQNRGTEASPASATRFHLSRDTALDGTDVALGERPVPALAIGASSTASTAVIVPAGTSAGRWFVIAEADAGRVVSESEEGNNTAAAYVEIGPDLAITSFSAPAVGGAGLALTVGDTTQNTGGGAAPASVTRFHLSANAILDAGDPVLGGRAVPALAPGAASSGS